VVEADVDSGALGLAAVVVDEVTGLVEVALVALDETVGLALFASIGFYTYIAIKTTRLNTSVDSTTPF
jgi:hypothetical protein